MGIGKIKFDDIYYEKSYSSWGVYFDSKLVNVLFIWEFSKCFEGIYVIVNFLYLGVVIIEL